VLLDSSAILALADASDSNHRRAVEVAHELARERRPVFITNLVEAEAHALLLRKVGRSVAREWLLQSGLDALRVTSDEERLAKELIATHDDKDWSLCDTTSFVVIERRRAGGAFTFDHHIRQRPGIRVWGLSPT
jgi:predicted nucleic acid-binding protein